MPARTQRLYLFPARAGQPGQVMDFTLWWDRSGFFEKYGDRQIDTGHPLFVDYALLLTAGEANSLQAAREYCVAGGMCRTAGSVGEFRLVT